MRFLIIVAGAVLLATPAIAPARADDAKAASATHTTKMHKKMAKKSPKPKKEKVEYMRVAP